MTVRDLVFIALFAAFIIALGLIPGIAIPVMPGVPITFQGIGFMLSGALLGWKRGFLCAVVIWVLVAAGLPILAGGRGGLGVFVGNTVGYLFGNGFGAALIGFLFEKSRDKLNAVKIITFLTLGGIVVTYGMGIVGYYALTQGKGLWVIILQAASFLPVDAFKIAVCYAVIRIVNKSFPDSFLPRR